jgi:hypothetical protein
MAKPHATRTYAPLQFDALNPSRFEDLVRDLLYDYRDWYKIEATGRSGADSGVDIRAFEKTDPELDRDDDEEESPPSKEGNLWIIQCKRERELGPARIIKIIKDGVSKDQPPYGYVLAAPVNFSAKAYDVFRATLAELGVTEFQLLGRAELEDMLYLPKNDRILFAFFGMSLVSKKRSRVTEIRSVVNNKNKLYKIFGEGDHNHTFSKHVLVRDTNDYHYPHIEKYRDFEKNPRWREYIAISHHVEGIRFNMHEYFAYVDRDKKEWDFTSAIDLVHRTEPDQKKQDTKHDLRAAIEDFWVHMPLVRQAKYVVDGLIEYADFDLIDKEGDAVYKMPHFYVDFRNGGPFEGYWNCLTRGENAYYGHPNEYKRINVFPKKFAKPKFGKVYKDKSIELESYLISRMRHGNPQPIVDLDNKYKFLKQRDVIVVASTDADNSKTYVEVTHRQTSTAAQMKEWYPELEWEAEKKAGRKIDPSESINILELKLVYDFQFERK